MRWIVGLVWLVLLGRSSAGFVALGWTLSGSCGLKGCSQQKDGGREWPGMEGKCAVSEEHSGRLSNPKERRMQARRQRGLKAGHRWPQKRDGFGSKAIYSTHTQAQGTATDRLGWAHDRMWDGNARLERSTAKNHDGHTQKGKREDKKQTRGRGPQAGRPGILYSHALLVAPDWGVGWAGWGGGLHAQSNRSGQWGGQWHTKERKRGARGM